MSRKQVAGGIVALVVLFPFLVILFIPAGQVKGLIQRSLAEQGYTFTAGRFGKAFPLGITARNVEIGDDRGPLVRLDRVAVRLAILPLFTGATAFSVTAAVGAGTVDFDWRSGRKGVVRADIRGVRLEDIPFFRTAAGATAKGIFRGEARLAGSANRLSGTIKLEVRGAELAELKIGELPLPSATYDTIQGMLRVREGRGRVESLTFEGSGLYARLSGEIPLAASAPLDLALELMPKADFLEQQKYVFLLLVKYLESPGHYRIPIRGTLAKPAVF